MPSPFYMQKVYWALVGAALTFATLVNLLEKVLASQR